MTQDGSSWFSAIWHGVAAGLMTWAILFMTRASLHLDEWIARIQQALDED